MTHDLRSKLSVPRARPRLQPVPAARVIDVVNDAWALTDARWCERARWLHLASRCPVTGQTGFVAGTLSWNGGLPTEMWMDEGGVFVKHAHSTGIYVHNMFYPQTAIQAVALDVLS